MLTTAGREGTLTGIAADKIAKRKSLDAKSKQEQSSASKAPRTRLQENRLDKLRDLQIEFIPSPEFVSAKWKSLFKTQPNSTATKEHSKESAVDQQSEVAPSQVARMCKTPLLTPDEEVYLFRKINFLKYSADRLRNQLLKSKGTADAQKLREVERLLAEANEVRNQIIRANLRLVVANAKRYVNAGNTFDELLSEGSFSLMRAVEKYDYTRGNRFSTYATRAIRNNLYHFVSDRQRHRQHYSFAEDEILLAAKDTRADVGAMEIALSQTKVSMRTIIERLDAQQRQVIQSRFGLQAGSEPKTLKEIAGEMGISRERVRQIEGRALRQLRQFANDAHVEPPND